MAFPSADAPERLLQDIKQQAARLEQTGLSPDKVKRTIERVETIVAAFPLLCRRFELAHKESLEALTVKRAALEEKESSLIDRQREIDAAILVLESQKALDQLRDDMAKLPAKIGVHDEDIKQKLVSFNDVLDGIKSDLVTVTDNVKALPGGTDASLSSLKTDLLDGVRERLTQASDAVSEYVAKDIAHITALIPGISATTRSLSSTNQELLDGVDATKTAIKDSEATLMASISSCEAKSQSLHDQASTSLAAAQDHISKQVLERLRSLKKTFKEEVHDNFRLWSIHVDQTILDEGLVIRNHIDSELDSKLKAVVKEEASELSSTLGEVRTELARRPDEDKMGSMIEKISRVQDIVDRLVDIKVAAKESDTSVSGGISELKDMLQGMRSGFSRQEELEKTLAETRREVSAVKADLQTCQAERNSLQQEVEELKAKGPVTPGPSTRGSGSDQAASSPGLDNEPGYGITDLQKRVIELETELRLTKESQQQKPEDLVSKKYLDDALAKMTKDLSLQDRNGSDTRTDDRDHSVSEPRDNETRSRKRARVQNESSNSSEGTEETTFTSTCSAIHEAMTSMSIVQSAKSSVEITQIVISLTQAFAFADLKDRVMNFISRDGTEDWFCFGAVATSDRPSKMCLCHQLEGPPSIASKCLSVRVLDHNTKEVEFDLVESGSQV